MDLLQKTQPKAKRVRSNPTKKWSVTEEKTLLDFLAANRDFEKPTAQAYYKRFSQEANIPVEWKLTRAKVRNMRISYNKAKEWKGSTGAASMEGETMKTTLLKMCTFFYELDKIFGSRLVEVAVIEESLDCPPSNGTLNSTALDIEETTMSSPSLTRKSESGSESEASTSRKGRYSRTAVSDIMHLQSEMLKLKKQKIEQDFAIRERELKIKERELILKEKEMELKEKELEMRERVAMEELKLKYK